MPIGSGKSSWLIGLLCLTGCSAAHHHAAADREVYDIVARREQQLFGRSSFFHVDTAYSTRDPKTIPPDEIIRDRFADGQRKLSLTDALGMATANNRMLQMQREQLYLVALDLTGTRHQFTFRATETSANLGINRDTDGSLDGDAALSLELSRMFKGGGTLAAGLANDLVLTFGGKPKVPSITLALTQPLLRGAGAEMAAELLTQAEREVVYAIREFSYFQKTFAVGVVTDYLRLLQSQDTVRNSYTNYRNLTEVRLRAEAMGEAQQLPRYQVDQARQREFGAREQYIASVESYRTGLDEFKQLLGLPLGERVELDPAALVEVQKLGLKPFTLDERQGYATAIAHRLDVVNVIDQFEDAKRKVAVAANGLLPDLMLVSDAQLANKFYSSFKPGQVSASAGLRLDLPLDRLPERNAYRTSRIHFEKQLRVLATTLDGVRESIRRDARSLEQARQNYLIQQTALALARQRVEVMPIQVELDPTTDIRNVLEAQADLVRVQNAVTEAMVDYHVTRLNLLKELGTLNVEGFQFWLRPQPLPGADKVPVNGAGGALPEVVPPDQIFKN